MADIPVEVEMSLGAAMGLTHALEARLRAGDCFTAHEGADGEVELVRRLRAILGWNLAEKAKAK